MPKFMTKDETINALWERSGHGTQRDDIVAAYEAGAAAERAACADLCDAIGRAGTMLSGADAHAHHCADEIRKRPGV